VQLLEVFPTEHHLAIVMEFAAGGDLSELIDARGRQDVSKPTCCMVVHSDGV
jgi:serine/threonine protein kinase